YIATDDRPIERVNGPCDHRRCPPNECLMFSPATLEITDKDRELAVQLVAEGWWSTSHKYRSVARWREPIPPIDKMFQPEFLTSFQGQRIAAYVKRYLDDHYDVRNHKYEEHIEDATLSPSLFLAFKQAGGDCGR